MLGYDASIIKTLIATPSSVEVNTASVTSAQVDLKSEFMATINQLFFWAILFS